MCVRESRYSDRRWSVYFVRWLRKRKVRRGRVDVEEVYEVSMLGGGGCIGWL